MIRPVAFLTSLLMFWSCASPETGSVQEPAVATSESALSSLPVEPGRRCFSYRGEHEFKDVDLMLAADGSVLGSYAYMWSDPDSEAYAETIASFTGSLKEDVIELSLLTYDVGEASPSSETWHLTSEGLTVDGTLLTSCPAPETWCAADEQSLFSCPLADGSIASLCGPIGMLTTGDGYLQFRSGPSGSDPYRFPEVLNGSLDLFESEVAMYSGGWDSQIRFVDGDRDVRLFDRATKVSMSEKDFSSGLTISVAGAEPEEKRCMPGSTEFGDMLIDQLQGLVPDGEFMFE